MAKLFTMKTIKMNIKHSYGLDLSNLSIMAYNVNIDSSKCYIAILIPSFENDSRIQCVTAWVMI